MRSEARPLETGGGSTKPAPLPWPWASVASRCVGARLTRGPYCCLTTTRSRRPARAAAPLLHSSEGGGAPGGSACSQLGPFNGRPQPEEGGLGGPGDPPTVAPAALPHSRCPAPPQRGREPQPHMTSGCPEVRGHPRTNKSTFLKQRQPVGPERSQNLLHSLS